MYDVLKFLHVLTAIVWVGGGLALNFLGTRLVAAGTSTEIAGFTRQVEWMGTRVFMPSSLVLLIAGIIMTITDWSFEELWIVIGIGGFLYSFINGAFLVGPLSGRTGKLLSERGADDPEVSANIQRIFVLGRIELAILVIVVWAMTMKPTI
jgi:uncharacterized membrane protein